VLIVRRPIIIPHKTETKFMPERGDPCFVREVYTNATYKIVGNDGVQVGPINDKFLKRYYPYICKMLFNYLSYSFVQ